MKSHWMGHQWIKTGGWFIGLLLFLSCKKWDLPDRGSLTKGLIAYYPFNGSPLDVGGNNLHGQLKFGTTYGPGKSGKSATALVLDGIDDYFEIADHEKLRPSAISVSLWIKPQEVTSTSHIYNKSDFNKTTSERLLNQQYSALIRPPYDIGDGKGPGSQIWADINQDGQCTTELPLKEVISYHDPQFQMNRWYHFVSVFEGSIGKIYLDGVLKSAGNEQPATPIDKCIGGNLRFGAQAEIDPNYFMGSMDEIRIYNRALTETEIKALSRQWE